MRRSTSIVDKLTMIGLEVESVEDKGKLLAPYVIAQRDRGEAASERRPAARLHGRHRRRQADPGRVRRAECAHRHDRRVRAAGHLRSRQEASRSQVGTIRGVESRGMLVSEAELEISDDHDGIIDLPADAPVGASLRQVCRPRRSGDRDQPDAEPARLHRRHTASRAISRRPTSARSRNARRSRVKGEFPCPVVGEARLRRRRHRSARRSRCASCAASRTARRRNGCRSGCTAIGLRPINALVDITNFITFDRGRPLHVFDAAKVKGNLAVRRAQNGEKLAGARRQDLHARRTPCA